MATGFGWNVNKGDWSRVGQLFRKVGSLTLGPNATPTFESLTLTTSLDIGTLTLASGSITDSSGAISFGNENLVTTGTLGAGAITGTSLTDGTTTISGGNYTGVGNITGSDSDVNLGTGDFETTGFVEIGGSPTELVSNTTIDKLISFKTQTNGIGTRRAGLFVMEYTGASIPKAGIKVGLNAFGITTAGDSGSLSRTDAPGGLVGGRYASRMAGGCNVLMGGGVSAYAEILDTGTGTYIDAYGLLLEGSQIHADSSGTITRGMGVWIKDGSAGGGTFGTQYGIRIENQTAATTNWAIYSEGADSFHSGDLAFGQTDKAERIGSDADGTLDLYAGTSVDLHTDTNITGDLSIGTATDMLAPLNITGDTASIEDRHEGIWIRGKTGAYIVQINVRGPRLEIGGGASLDTTPAMSVNYLTGRVGIGTTTPSYILDIDAGEIGETNYDGLRIVDTGWKATSHPMLEFYNSHASFNGSLVRIYGEIGSLGENSKLYFAVADSSKNLQDRMVIDKDGNVGIGTTSPDTKLQAVGVSRFGEDTTNYSEFESDGTLEFNGTATVFEDIVISLDSAKVPAANAPTWSNFISNLMAYTYGVNDFQEFTSEISHSYKEGSTILFHIHGATNGQEGSDKTIKFEIEYELIDNQTSGAFGDVYAGTTTINAEITIPSGTTDKTSWVIDVGTDATGNFLQGAGIKGRVRRIASSGAEPAADPFVVQVGVHIEQDTVGSRTELTK